ncbi:MAG TPA: serine/threonine-protein kinase, partial [Vicinamibacteria bacterium]
MAEVWRGEHVRQAVPVAVKVMSARATRDPQARAAFRQEVQAVAGLDHPGIVLVFDHGETGREAEEASNGFVPAGRPYLAMELADRGTLREVRAGVTWPRVRAVLLDLLEALGHAHARGVVHRDLKPSNVLACGGDEFPARFKLADFGLAYAVGRGARDEAGAVSGTPAYMAPEQILGQWRDDGPWTDLYALGCMAYEMLSGHGVFAETTLTALADAHLYREPAPLAALVPVPAGLEGWLRRLLRKDPRERFQRAADAAHALRALPSVDPESQVAIALDERPTLLDLQPRAAPAGRAREGLDTAAAREPLCARELPPFPAAGSRPMEPAASPALLGVGLGLYGLRPIPFVGREREREVLWQALADVVRRRRPRLVVLQGGAGSGKTRLAEWLAERAHEVGHAHVMDA